MRLPNKEEKKQLLFTPIVTETPITRRREDIERIQMFNRFTDPQLNLFDTYRQRQDLQSLCRILVAYDTQK